MTLREFLGNFFKKPSKSMSGDVMSDNSSYEELYTGAINAFAVFAVIDMIVSANEHDVTVTSKLLHGE